MLHIMVQVSKTWTSVSNMKKALPIEHQQLVPFIRNAVGSCEKIIKKVRKAKNLLRAVKPMPFGWLAKKI